jgi:hypothetical protein
MRTIDYPNALQDLVVLEYAAPDRMGFSIKPLQPGLFRLMVWPRGMADADLFRHALMEFEFAAGPPKRVTMDLVGSPHRAFRFWEWTLIPTREKATPLEDLGRALFGLENTHRGVFELVPPERANRARCVAWSCHMPYETRNGVAVMEKNALKILDWYAKEVRKFRPDVIWGGGDTAYSDGTSATDFANEVYGKGTWYRNPESREWLRREYRKMYRHFWSLEPMRMVLASYPHLFIWDDHEIRDGWGSEGIDFRPGNLEMFRIAKDVAEEFILNSGPRIRPDGFEAHQAYVTGPLAAFIFDTRSRRNYEIPGEKLISREQFEDFTAFLDIVKADSNVTDLITQTSVPFVGLRTWTTELITRLPKFLTDWALRGVRDDVRDSWTSPGNLPTLSAVLDALRFFMAKRPDVRVTNVSGDIHVAQAYKIIMPGATAPIHQVTTSAITNRTHPSDLVAALIEISRDEFIPGVGLVSRVWDTVTEPNILTIDISGGRAKFDLKVWNQEHPGESDLSLTL